MRHVSRWVLILALAGCEREVDQPTEAPSAVPVSSGAPADPERLVGGDVVFEAPLRERTAFDLVATDQGVVLVVAAPAGGLFVQGLDQRGRATRRASVAPASSGAPIAAVPSGAPAKRRLDVPSSVVEVAAAARAGRLAIAWVAEGGDGGVASVALGQLPELSFSSPIDLGAATLATTERGHITVAAIDGARGASGSERFVVFHRGPKEPCDEEPAGCTTFPLHQVDGAGATPRRVLLSVPAPCGRGVAGFATNGDRWYYGVCALDEGRATTTMFTIEHDPEYAQAEPVLPGCVPLGTAVVDGDALLVGRCGRERRAVRLGRRDVATTPLGLDGAELVCDRGSPVLEAGTAVHLRLESGAGDVAALLPPHIAPVDARAIYTGEALLVATALPGKVAVRRYRCVAEP